MNGDRDEMQREIADRIEKHFPAATHFANDHARGYDTGVRSVVNWLRNTASPEWHAAMRDRKAHGLRDD